MQIQKHNIVSGEYTDGRLYNTKETGYSFLGVDDNFYTVKLNMFPIFSFFLVKNKENDNYTIYSRLLRSEDQVRFKNPVGFGRLLPDNKSLMLLRFNMPRMTMYMDLFAE